MNTKALVTIIVILLVVIGVGYFFLSSEPATTVVPPSPLPISSPSVNATVTPTPIAPANVPSSVATTTGGRANTRTPSSSTVEQNNTLPPVEYTITEKNYSFTPNRIIVEPGTHVRLTIVNDGGTHDFVLPAYNIATKPLNTGEQAVVEFTASKSGSFEYYCSIANHRAMGMTGTLLVGEEE